MSKEKEPTTVAVLGLGRMGRAIAERLVGQRWDVVTWTRSGVQVPGARAANSPQDAANQARVVLLTLFDARACRDVLKETGPALDAETVVINLSTIGPSEVPAIRNDATRSGAAYLHAPVMGSVGAARSGELVVLLGSDGLDDDNGPVVEALGTPVPTGDAETAAAAKLLANGVLAGSLLTIRDGMRHARDLGVDAEVALTILARTPPGRLVTAKRSRLLDREFSHADFTLRALAKDVALLAQCSPASESLAARLEAATQANGLESAADVAALADVHEPTGRHDDVAVGLTIAADIAPDHPVLTPLRAYVRGHATGDPRHFARAFFASAHIEGLRDGDFISWPLDDYCAIFDGEPAADEAQRRRQLQRVDIVGNTASATMTLWHGAYEFADVFLLVRVEEEWRISNKVFERREAPRNE